MTGRASTPKEIAITGPLDRTLLSVVHERYLPNRVIAATPQRSGGDTGRQADGIALLTDKPPTDQPTAYVCEHFVCKQPTSDPDELARQLA